MPKQELIGGVLCTVHPSFVEQMARHYYDATDANARAVPWEGMIPIRRELLIRVMGEVLAKDAAAYGDDE